MTKQRYSISKVFLIGIVLTSTISAVLLWGIWALERRQAFESDASNLTKAYVSQHNQLVEREINAALDFIRFKRRQADDRIRENLRDRVNEAHAIASHIYNSFRTDLSLAELQDIIRESIRPIRFLGGRGYFFATDFNGTEQLFADRPEMEGKNLLDIHDTEGRPIVRDMIDLVKKQGEGFYTYTWTKPEAPGRNYPKLSFVKEFAPIGWFIGAGEYLDDMDADIQQEVLERLSQIRFGDNGYLFVLRYDSTMLVHPNAELRGQRMVDAKIPTLRELFPRLMEASAKTGSGYYEYSWPKPDGDGRSNKVAYVARLPDWDWLIGAGFHLDEVDAQISAEKKHLASNLTNELLRVALLLALVFVAALVIAHRISRQIDGNLSQFNDFFKKAAEGAHQIDTNQIGFVEFTRLARSANRMIEDRERIEKSARQLEAQLMQRQKLEAIGTLAGGIAHDFNNLLAVVFGNLSLLKMKTPENDPKHRYIVRIDDAASRARDLVSQILTFSRRSELDKRPLPLSDIILEAIAMLRSTIPSSIQIETYILADRALIFADATQMHQVIMNLCTNASQALAGGGRIEILLEKMPDNESPLEARPALHLQVYDNGPGIAIEHLERIFDPFYSTKGTGNGTGLGLSVVHSIIESHQGRIQVESDSEGTRFHIYLPLLEDAPKSQENPPEARQLKEGNGTILLVDDESSVCQTHEDLLQSLGYQVKSFTDPRKALEEVQTHPERYDLLITDQTMPGMSGIDLARDLRSKDIRIPIILCTGYSASADESSAQAADVDRFLMKPISAIDLSHTLDELLQIRPS